MRGLVFTLSLFLFCGLVQAQESVAPSDVLAAARAGSSEAQLEMGILYQYGFFMSENKAPALAWYMLSADSGNEKAIRLRDKLQREMPSAEVEQARQLKLTLGPVATQPAPAMEPTSPAEPAPAEPAAPTNEMPAEPAGGTSVQ